MNNLKFYLLSFCLLMVTMSYGQKIDKKDSIIALKLEKTLASKFEKGLKIPGIVVMGGVLRPMEGFEILVLEKTEEFVIKPIERKVLDRSQGDFDIRNIGGITIVCHCGLSGGDDCQFYDVPQGSDTHVYCGGRCPCGSFSFANFKSVRQFETMDGGWQPDWR